MKCPKTLLLAGLLLLAINSDAQTPILRREKVDETYHIPVFGPNRAQFVWLQLSLMGTDIPAADRDTKADFSHYYALDAYHKFKINSVCSHGYSGGIHRQVFRLSPQGLLKNDRGDWDKGKILLWGIHTQYFWRFNLDPRRGNTTGWFVDLAAVAHFNLFQKQHYQKDKLKEKYRQGHLAERYAVAGEIRIGHEAFSLYFRYKGIAQASQNDEDLITATKLPAFSLGLNIGLPIF